MIRNMILLGIFFFLSSCEGEFACDNNPVGPSTSTAIEYKWLRGYSPDYCIVFKDYTPLLNFIRGYNANMTRTFAYCGWDIKQYPWNGNYGNVKSDYLSRLKNYVSTANSNGIVPIIVLFQDNAGGGTENITRADRNELKTYIQKVVEALSGYSVIYEPINENSSSDFNKWVLTELKKYGVKTIAYSSTFGQADMRMIHSCKGTFEGSSDAIQNNDTPCLKYMSDEDLYNVAKGSKNGKGFEFLLAWGREGREGFIGNDIQKMESEYGSVMKRIAEL